MPNKVVFLYSVQKFLNKTLTEFYLTKFLGEKND